MSYFDNNDFQKKIEKDNTQLALNDSGDILFIASGAARGIDGGSIRGRVDILKYENGEWGYHGKAMPDHEMWTWAANEYGTQDGSEAFGTRTEGLIFGYLGSDTNAIYPKDYEGQRDKAILEMFYSTGMRLSELINLRISDIDFSSMTVKVFGKRAKQRVIPMMKSHLVNLKVFLDNLIYFIILHFNNQSRYEIKNLFKK